MPISDDLPRRESQGEQVPWKTRLVVWASVLGLAAMITLVLAVVIVLVFATQLPD